MKKRKGITIWRCLSFVWLLFLSAAYFWPTDALYAITIWPPFVWANLAMVLTLAGVRRFRTRSQGLLLFAWIAFWIGFGEDKWWLMDRVISVKNPTWKVVTLNCAGGFPEAAEEAFQLEPDIIFLQESPSKKDIDELAQQYFRDGYDIAWGVDASIIVRRGSLRVIEKTIAFTTVAYQPPDGDPLVLCSLRLSPPVFRLDYWSADCWQAYASNRQMHRRELTEVSKSVLSQTDTFDAIVAGDFYWTPDSEMQRIFFHELSPISRGSGYSAVNEFPLARIDQVWASFEAQLPR